MCNAYVESPEEAGLTRLKVEVPGALGRDAQEQRGDAVCR